MPKLLKFFIFFLIVFVLLTAIGAWCFYSPVFWERTAVWQIQKRAKNITVQKLTINAVEHKLPNLFQFKHIQAELLIGKTVYAIESDLKVDADFFGEKKILAEMSNTSIKTDKLMITALNSQANVSLENYDGNAQLSIGIAKFRDYQATHIKTDFQWSDNQVVMTNGHAQLYGGDATANGTVNLTSEYVFNIQFSELDAKRLEKANKAVFSFFKGQIQGDIRIVGNKNAVTDLTGEISLMPGSFVKSSFIAQYVKELERTKIIIPDKLKEVVKQDVFMPVEYETFTIKGISDNKLLLVHNLWSKEYYINIVDSPLTIIIDNDDSM